MYLSYIVTGNVFPDRDIGLGISSGGIDGCGIYVFQCFKHDRFVNGGKYIDSERFAVFECDPEYLQIVPDDYAFYSDFVFTAVSAQK